MKKPRKHFTGEEKVAIARRHCGAVFLPREVEVFDIPLGYRLTLFEGSPKRQRVPPV